MPNKGQVLTKTIYLSLDPYQWGRRRNGVERPGDVCHGRTVSQVLQSRSEVYGEGDYLFNTNGWQEIGLTGEGIDVFGYMHPRKLDPRVVRISTAVGVLGMLGLTAYAGLILQCSPRSGDTVVVSAASGGVGQVVGQLASIYGCRVVGIAGTREKCDFLLNELGFDAALSHRDDHLAERLRAACPDGIDVYFESVGGKVYEAVLPLLNQHSRITQCGLISKYGDLNVTDAYAEWQRKGEDVFRRKRVSVHSLFVGNFVAEHQEEFLELMTEWLRQDRVKYREHVWNGIREVPRAFQEMLRGGNFGKSLVKISDDPTLMTNSS